MGGAAQPQNQRSKPVSFTSCECSHVALPCTVVQFERVASRVVRSGKHRQCVKLRAAWSSMMRPQRAHAAMGHAAALQYGLP
jgi:hypothetical protein